jgi:hypothetical protein
MIPIKAKWHLLFFTGHFNLVQCNLFVADLYTDKVELNGHIPYDCSHAGENICAIRKY